MVSKGNVAMSEVLNIRQIAAETKVRNVPFVLDAEALYGLVFRIAGNSYAEAIQFQQIEPAQPGMDRFAVSDLPGGKLLIEATSGVAAANAFRWYLENRCDSYVGPLNRRLNFPDNPPAIGERYTSDGVSLYRYFLNYCTFGYTFLFWQWDRWEDLIDWMMLAGYNLILNPVGTELVWLTALQKMGYTLEEARQFIASPAVYPWQCMNNIENWSGAASMEYYGKRLELSKKINARIRSFGAEIVAPGWSGMVPQDFDRHFPDSKPIHQGKWCLMPRPSIILQDDIWFPRVAYYFYKSLKDLLGEFKYFSTDPFHEGGDSSNVDLDAYAKACLKQMQEFSPNAVWFLQGWGSNPLRKILNALPVSNVLIGDLQALCSIQEDSFANYPWLFGTVDNFGGQRRIRGNLSKLLSNSLVSVLDEDMTCVGLAMLPEDLESGEIMFDVIADYAISSQVIDQDDWLKKRLRIRYGADSSAAFEAWRLLRDHIYNGKEPQDSGLLSRPSLSVSHVIAQVYELTYDNEILKNAVHLLFRDYDKLCDSEAYRMDMMDATRQMIANDAWQVIKKIQQSYFSKDQTVFEENADKLMKYYDLQDALTGTDKHALFGVWLKLARAEGNTAAEKAYMEFQARTMVTLWGDREGSDELHDYAAREWNGLLQDFYKQRWLSYLNILRCSLVTGNKPLDYNRYDAEYFFTTVSKEYPTEPYGDMKKILTEVCTLFPV